VEILGSARVPLARAREEDHPDLGWLFRSPAFARLVEAHRRRFALYRGAFEDFLARASRKGIPVLAIKAAPDFPYESRNLDLLVHPEAMEEAGALLAGLGFRRIGHYREPHKSLYKKFDPGGDRTTFHLHEELGWHGAVFLDREEVWRRRLPLEGLSGAWRLHAGDLVTHTLAHAVYENAALRASDLARILRARPLGPEVAAAAGEQARRHGWRAGWRLALRALALLESGMRGSAECAEALGWRGRAGGSGPASSAPGPALAGAGSAAPRLQVDLGKVRSRLLLAAKVLGSGDSPWPRRLRTLSAWLASQARGLAGLPAHRGLLVTLSGVDGSGKSSQAGRLLAFLEECDARGKVIWARGGSTPLLLWAKSRLRRLGRGGGALQARPAAEPLAPGWQRRLWPWIVASELALVVALRVAPALLGRRVAICDRYLLDAEVDLYFRLGRSDPRRLLPWRILRGLAPAADAAFLLDASARDIVARKEVGMELAHIEERRAAYATLADAGVACLGAGDDPERVAERIARTVLDALGRGRR
jgi:thymidylate kinase